MLLAIVSSSLEACFALGRAYIRLTSAPPPKLRDLDSRTLRDIGVPAPPARPSALADSDEPLCD